MAVLVGVSFCCGEAACTTTRVTRFLAGHGTRRQQYWRSHTALEAGGAPAHRLAPAYPACPVSLFLTACACLCAPLWCPVTVLPPRLLTHCLCLPVCFLVCPVTGLPLLPLPDQARFEEATYRTTRWLDRCMKANRNPDKQNLFPIVQGGFDVQLRETSMQQVQCVRVCAVLHCCSSAHAPACQHPAGCSLLAECCSCHLLAHTTMV